ncbi:MAG: hypothetical protein V4533_13800 [Pseudomonadota bacterium]
MGTWFFMLGSPDVERLISYVQSSKWAVINWFAMMMVVMVVSDRVFCRYADRRWGIDPMKVHWSTLKNRDGFHLCPACLSPFLLPPEDFNEQANVECGDCGHAIATYGEMKPVFDDQNPHMAGRMGLRQRF